jgi:hypothetical protein
MPSGQSTLPELRRLAFARDDRLHVCTVASSELSYGEASTVQDVARVHVRKADSCLL